MLHPEFLHYMFHMSILIIRLGPDVPSSGDRARRRFLELEYVSSSAPTSERNPAMKAVSFLLIALCLSLQAAAQIPESPEVSMVNGKRHGTIRFWDAAGKLNVTEWENDKRVN
jgi:hypothetical protein